ncbi:MAG: aminoacyl--tRNA ligase-related protein [Patescibacteria group bacterium]
MRYSQLFIRTKRDAAKQDSASAHLLDKAGFVAQASAGVFTLLPLGLRSIEKITEIIREEMNAIGASELHLPSMQTKALWQKSGRWDDKAMKEILYIDADGEVCFAPTHEEQVSELVRPMVRSYRDLPILIYQFQTKFRRELRPRSGMLRGREFLMKDLYSFHPNVEAHNEFYEIAAGAYQKAFKRLGLEAYRVKASGGVFGKEHSDEFQVLCDTGEDEILINRSTLSGYNKEVEGDLAEKEKTGLERVKAIEVGNIFHLGTKYAEAFDLNYLDNDGKQQKAVMGSYGIGITRLLATLAEVYHDENGLKLPVQVAPFQVYLVDLTSGKMANESGANLTDGSTGEKLEKELDEAGIEVLYDDRAVSAGEKFTDADLIGAPIRLVYSQKTAEENAVELKLRSDSQTKLVGLTELTSKVRQLLS